MPQAIPSDTVTGAAYRDAMARLAGAVHLVTTDGPAGRAGFTASAVCSVSDAPPTLLVCINRTSSAYEAVCRNGQLCVNTLAAGQEPVAAAFGGGAPMAERFAAGTWRAGPSGLPMLAGALTGFACRIGARHTVGSHDVLFCEVFYVANPEGGTALVYAGRHYRPLPIADEPTWRAAAE
ncbi:flavin reductase [Methylobacterium sp. A54F]